MDSLVLNMAVPMPNYISLLRASLATCTSPMKRNQRGKLTVFACIGMCGMTWPTMSHIYRDVLGDYSKTIVKLGHPFYLVISALHAVA